MMQTQSVHNPYSQNLPLYPTEGVYGQPVANDEIPVLEPDDDLRRAITAEEFKTAVIDRVRKYYHQKNQVCE
jgi:hypothetical protein